MQIRPATSQHLHTTSGSRLLMIKMPHLTQIQAREILDSRGYPTLEVTVTTDELLTATASVPSGVSTGKHEARERRDGGKRFLGKGVQKAVKNVQEKIAPLLTGIDCTRQKEIDHLMIELDGTKNKNQLGANALLAVSLACAKAAAMTKGLLLYEYLHQLTGLGQKMALPQPYFNIINGGKHAGNNLAIQEFLIAPRAKTFAEALRMGSETYHLLGKIIERKYGKKAINVGDEGGFAPPLERTEEALILIKKAVAKAGYTNKIELALDCAASQFFDRGKYLIDGKKRSQEQLLKFYLRLIKKYHLLSLEDPFEEEDFAGFARLARKSKIQIVTDDLTVSNLQRLEKAIREKSGHCLLLKVNQIGTLSEALDAVRLAYENGWKVMVSHRSGETEDTFIADLAVGIGCGRLKAGAPCRGERTAKYNQLLRIEETLKEGK